MKHVNNCTDNFRDIPNPYHPNLSHQLHLNSVLDPQGDKGNISADL